MRTKPKRRAYRVSRRSYKRNPSKSVSDPHAARELALCYDNERAQQAQKESIINNLAKKMAMGKYDKALAVKLWSYAAKSGADAYAKAFGSYGDTGSSMFNAATRLEASKILEDENRDYVKERSEEFAAKMKPRHKRNPAPSEGIRAGRFQSIRDKLLEKLRSAEKRKDSKLYNFYGRKLLKLSRIERDVVRHSRARKARKRS